jgi:putative ABC transport system permease protein
MYPELQTEQAHVVQDLARTQDGAIVGAATMSKYGWKIGQRITLQAPLSRKNGSHDWPFQIVGSYQNKEQPDQAILILANYRYINESKAGQPDTILFAIVRIADPSQAAQVAQAIDRQFSNSLNETLTQSEQELMQAQVENLGDLDVAVHRITAATFFVLLFATGALMMQSIRERTPELGVLKTVGYSSPLVVTLILAETQMLCVTGAALGMWIASRLLRLASSFTGLGSIPAIVIEAGLACATILALAAGSIPAWRALRLRAVDALANR